MIRAATPEDIPALVEMGERFAAKAKAPVFDPESVARTIGHLIESPAGIVLVNGTGTIACLTFPHPFDHGRLVGQELFWWSEGAGGLALVSALEAEARTLGVTVMMMAAMESLSPERVGNVYLRRGYRPLDRYWVKEL